MMQDDYCTVRTEWINNQALLEMGENKVEGRQIEDISIVVDCLFQYSM